MLQNLRIKIESWLLKHLLKAVTLEEVVSFDKQGEMWVGNTKPDGGFRNDLIGQARFFKDASLERMINQTLKQKAHEVIFNKSTSIDDVRAGKMLLYSLDLREKIINAVAEQLSTKK